MRAVMRFLLVPFLLLVGSGIAGAHPVCDPDGVPFHDEDDEDLDARHDRGSWRARDVPFEVVLSQTFSGFRAPAEFVIRSERQWCRFWRGVHGEIRCDSSGFDFRRETVLAAAMGERTTGCHSIQVTGVERLRRRRIRVSVEERSPGRDCVCFHAFTQPVVAVVVPGRVRRGVFVREEIVFDCPR